MKIRYNTIPARTFWVFDGSGWQAGRHNGAFQAAGGGGKNAGKTENAGKMPEFEGKNGISQQYNVA